MFDPLNDSALVDRTGIDALLSQEPEGFTWWDHVYSLAKPDLALVYMRLIVPEFVVYRGMIFLTQCVAHCGGTTEIDELCKSFTPAQVEEIVNVFDFTLVMGSFFGEDNDGAEKMFAGCLASTWQLMAASIDERLANYKFDVLQPSAEGGLAIRMRQVP